MDDDVKVVVPTDTGGTLFRARVADVSEGGVGLHVLPEDLEDAASSGGTGSTTFHKGMRLVVGFRGKKKRLWVPAEIVHYRRKDNAATRLGVRFLSKA
jgi:hypothetical protein